MSRFGPRKTSWFRRKTVTHGTGLFVMDMWRCGSYVWLQLWVFLSLRNILPWAVFFYIVECHSEWRSQGAEGRASESRRTTQTLRLRGLYAALWLNLSFTWWSLVSQSLCRTRSPSVYHKLSLQCQAFSDFFWDTWRMQWRCIYSSICPPWAQMPPLSLLIALTGTFLQQSKDDVIAV